MLRVGFILNFNKDKWRGGYEYIKNLISLINNNLQGIKGLEFLVCFSQSGVSVLSKLITSNIDESLFFAFFYSFYTNSIRGCK